MEPCSAKPTESALIWMKTDQNAILLFPPQTQQFPEVRTKY